jgi:hypothetical protein
MCHLYRVISDRHDLDNCVLMDMLGVHCTCIDNELVGTRLYWRFVLSSLFVVILTGLDKAEKRSHAGKGDPIVIQPLDDGSLRGMRSKWSSIP